MSDTLWHSHINIILTNIESKRLCDICSKTNDNLLSDEPWYINSFSEKDICSDCYPKLYELCISEYKYAEYKHCDICKQDIGKGNNYYKIPNVIMDICTKCYDNKVPFGVNCNKPGIVSGYGHYIIANHLSPDDYVIPPELTDAITQERNKLFIELLDFAVCLPGKYDNILEWTLITDLNECMIHSDACCALALNCVKAPYAVASIVTDNNGRFAMDIIYDNYHDYLKECAAFVPKNMKLDADPSYVCEYSSDEDERDPDDENKKIIAEYYQFMENCNNITEIGSEDDKKNKEMLRILIEKINKANALREPKKYVYQQFEEYIRRKNNLSFYYG